jgi:hypothetical protein
MKKAMRTQLTMIHTPYKVASTTLFDRIVQCRGSTGGHHQLLTGPIPKVRLFTLKSHSGRRKLAELEGITGVPAKRIITLIRPQKEIFVSAYFQDIDDTRFPYFFGSRSEVEKASAEVLVEHFLGFDWNACPHLSIAQNAAEIEEFCGVSYLADVANIKSYCVYAGKRRENAVLVGVGTLRALNDGREFRRFMRELRFPLFLRLQLRASTQSNLSSEKWYRSKIAEFRAHPAMVKFLADS